MLTFFNKENLKYLALTILITSLFPPISYAEESRQNLKRIPYDEVKSGSLFFKNKEGYFADIAQKSQFKVKINGLISRVDLTQTFQNKTADWLEAVYVFPLAENSAVDGMTMEIGTRKIVGKIKEKQLAKKLYQQAKRIGKKASLVSQQRPNLFTTKVANIAPYQEVKIQISYLQVIEYNNDVFSLNLPLTITPRYIPQQPSVDNQLGARQEHTLERTVTMTSLTIDNQHGWSNAVREKVNTIRDIDEISPSQIYPQNLANNNDDEITHTAQKVSINISLDAGLAIDKVESLHHSISKIFSDNEINSAANKLPSREKVFIKLANSNNLLEQDFVLNWQLASGIAPKAAFIASNDSDSHYGLLMVMPPKAGLSKVLKKEVVYIIDTSGSMGGVAIRQAKSALTYALTQLTPGDSFNIVEFNSNAKSLFPHLLTATKDNIHWAKQWVNNLAAGGGTEMYSALALSFEQLSKNKLSADVNTSTNTTIQQQVIFITDGAVGNEMALFNLIDQNLQEIRLHTIGIGSAPNRYFMSHAAESGKGTYRYIGQLNEVKHQMKALFDQINRPVMTNIKVDWPNKDVEFYPFNIPDLYAGMPLMLTAKWDKVSEPPKTVEEFSAAKRNTLKTIRVSGDLARTHWQQELKIKQTKNQNGIPTLWAREKIDHLMPIYQRSATKDKQKIRQQVTDLALHHKLLSAFTSFIAIEEKPARPLKNELFSKVIPNLMPKGSTQAIPIPSTALGLSGKLLISFILLIIASLLLVFYLRYKAVFMLKEKDR